MMAVSAREMHSPPRSGISENSGLTSGNCCHGCPKIKIHGFLALNTVFPPFTLGACSIHTGCRQIMIPALRRVPEQR
jgi:hypothetical protein